MDGKIKKHIEKLPSAPGVYIFKDKAGKILYIGKATSIRNRVKSYFSGSGGGFSRPIERAIGKIEKIEYQKTDSVLEALILESNLIKKLQPKYNVELKDDKSFAYFVVTKEEFPKILILRETDLNDRFESTNHSNLRIENRKDKLFGIKIAKTYGPYTSKKQMEVALKIIRRIFPFHSLKQKTEKGCLDFQIGTCPGPYAGNISKADYQKNIRDIRMILEGKKKSLLKKLEKEMKKRSKAHDFEKAADLRNKIFALQHIRDVALLTNGDPHPDFEAKSTLSQRERGLGGEGIRIEAYDISNISGTSAVGSMVVFKNNEPDKSQYRKFKIKTVQGADDVGMMREVLIRRFNNNWPKPDLILLDGGQGHLNMAQGVLKSLKLEIPLVAVAKGPERKNQELRIMNYESSKKFENIINDKNLLKQIMDEAHRFAITYHKKVRKEGFIE